mgnify:CR=1 FL=1
MGRDHVAYFSAEEGFGDGRLDGELAFGEVCLVRADDGILHAAVVGRVRYLHLAEQPHAVRVEPALVDDACVLQHLVHEAYAAHDASLFALGFLVFGPQLLIGVAAVGFVPKKAIGAADGIKGTFAYLIGDSFAKLGLGMIADGTPIFGLTGWAGTFAALDAAAIGCIVLMAMVAVLEERKIRRENRAQKLKTA